MKKFLLGVGFAEENIRILTDDQVGTKWMPTRENIFHQLKWLIHDAKKNDSYVNTAAIPRIMEVRENTIDGSLTQFIIFQTRYFLHYSGHGGQVRDLDGDETEGQDNCIFPVDHIENGVIIDDVSRASLFFCVRACS